MGSIPSTRIVEGVMHSRAIVAEALDLQAQGFGARRVARQLGLPLGTVRDWHAGKVPGHSRHRECGDEAIPECPVCGQEEHAVAELPRPYVYLLGLYLGDGCISTHRRRVYRLRIVLDVKYPLIIDECEAAMRKTMPANRVGRVLKPSNCVEVSSYSRAWPCLFPQHGVGPKHLRPIKLEPWQRALVRRWPKALLRGLIQSDGCRFINTGTGWRNPRYSFSNASEDIRHIFRDACDQLGLRWTSAPRTVYVSRKADVARMDEFIGPKA